MTDNIKPALTPEEWARIEGNEFARIALAHELMRGTLDPSLPKAVEGRPDHALAALALLGYFTWEDVDALRYYIEAHEPWDQDRSYGADEIRTWETLKSIADRIGALLPPRAPMPQERGT